MKEARVVIDARGCRTAGEKTKKGRTPVVLSNMLKVLKIAVEIAEIRIG